MATPHCLVILPYNYGEVEKRTKMYEVVADCKSKIFYGIINDFVLANKQ